mgnify:CR=1 FL=1
MSERSSARWLFLSGNGKAEEVDIFVTARVLERKLTATVVGLRRWSRAREVRLDCQNRMAAAYRRLGLRPPR